jgi:cathepsin L
MNFQLLIVAVLALFAPQCQGFDTTTEFADTLDDFNEFLMTHQKSYSSSVDYWVHFHAFTNTNKLVNEHNSKPNVTWKMGHNRFSDMHPFEYSYLNGFRQPNCTKTPTTASWNGTHWTTTPTWNGTHWTTTPTWNGTDWTTTPTWNGTHWTPTLAWNDTQWTTTPTWNGTHWTTTPTWNGTRWTTTPTWNGTHWTTSPKWEETDWSTTDTDWLTEESNNALTCNKKTVTRTHVYDPNQVLPDAVDWRANGWVTPVKDQKQCGSCWAFSSTGTMEGQHANVTGNLTSLSEQDLVDCVSDCFGCGGGWMNKAMEYVVLNGGVDTEKSYPYDGTTDNCSFSKTNVGATFSEVVNITKGDCKGLLHAVATVGPVSVAVNAEGIMNYVTGLYNDPTCDPTSLDHGVLVVGYGVRPTDGKKYWIVKNSWNAAWGQDGYIYWDRDVDDMCGICQAASYPVV